MDENWASGLFTFFSAVVILLAGWRWDFILRRRQQKSETIRELRSLLQDLQAQAIEYWTVPLEKTDNHSLEIQARKLQALFHLLSKKVAQFKKKYDAGDNQLSPMLRHFNHIITGDEFGSSERKPDLDKIPKISSRGREIILELERLIE